MSAAVVVIATFVTLGGLGRLVDHLLRDGDVAMNPMRLLLLIVVALLLQQMLPGITDFGREAAPVGAAVADDAPLVWQPTHTGAR